MSASPKLLGARPTAEPIRAAHSMGLIRHGDIPLVALRFQNMPKEPPRFNDEVPSNPALETIYRLFRTWRAHQRPSRHSPITQSSDRVFTPWIIASGALTAVLLLIDTVFSLGWPTLMAFLAATALLITSVLSFYRWLRNEVKSLGQAVPEYLEFLEQDGRELAALIAQLRTVDRETLAFAQRHLRHRHAMLTNRLGFLGVSAQLGLAPAFVSGLAGFGTLLVSARAALEPAGVPTSSPIVPFALFALTAGLAGLYAAGFANRWAALETEEELFALEEALRDVSTNDKGTGGESGG